MSGEGRGGEIVPPPRVGKWFLKGHIFFEKQNAHLFFFARREMAVNGSVFL